MVIAEQNKSCQNADWVLAGVIHLQKCACRHVQAQLLDLPEQSTKLAYNFKVTTIFLEYTIMAMITKATKISIMKVMPPQHQMRIWCVQVAYFSEIILEEETFIPPLTNYNGVQFFFLGNDMHKIRQG